MPENQSTDILINNEPRRTSLYCHSCEKNFVARIDYQIEGNHEIHCPCCGHIHFRVIKGGKVTDDRYSSDSQTTRVPQHNCTWRANDLAIITDTAQMFLRDKWLNRYNGEA